MGNLNCLASNDNHAPQNKGPKSFSQPPIEVPENQKDYEKSSHEERLLCVPKVGWRTKGQRQELDATITALKDDHNRLLDERKEMASILRDLKLMRSEFDATLFAFKRDHQRLLDEKKQIGPILKDLKLMKEEEVRRLKALVRQGQRKLPKKKSSQRMITLRIKEEDWREVLEKSRGNHQVSGPDGLA